MTPEEAQQQIRQGLEHHKRGQLALAEQRYRQVLAQDPHHPDALHLLGALACQSGRCADAVALIARAIQLRGDVADYHLNLAEALKGLERSDDALAALRAAVAVAPDDPHAAELLAAALLERNDLDAAPAVLEQSITRRPDHAAAHLNLGVILARQGKADEAIPHFQRAAALAPGDPLAHANLGVTYLSRDRTGDAAASFRHAIALKPDLFIAHNNLAIALQQAGFADQAIDALIRAVQLNPLDPTPFSNLLLAMHYTERFSPREIFDAHVQWQRRFAPHAIAASDDARSRDPGRMLNIGLVSPDLHGHSVSFFLEPLLRHHDRTRFAFHAYSDSVKRDAIAARLQGLCEGWTDATALDNTALAEKIRRDGIDILIDLAGHTGGGRLLLFAHKPAPVQITYLGYPDTTGLPSIDYRITDALADPPGAAESFHTEKLLRLSRPAWCYNPPLDAPSVSPPPHARNGSVTFGSFTNTLAKITDHLLADWCAILLRVPNARLILKARGSEDFAARGRIETILTRRNIDPARVQILGRDAALAEHLARYAQIDLGLDTFPYHGTTTTCDALWMGVPVLTRAGQSHVSRVGVSLLHAINLDDLIATGREDYIQRAVALAQNPQRLAALRATLRPRLQQSPLTDGPSFARALENALRSAWQTWCSTASR
ncbi:MAG TPA: tetratricopeptide repeat protein [Tepidisphaeraceae bacterium]|jgi:predicted O-linked N-acetylglucosamine transferase (SPINDLY family)